MTIPHAPYGPNRITQGFPLTGEQHQECHDYPITLYNALVDYINTLPIVTGGSIQTGMAMIWTAGPCPSGFLPAIGQDVSRTTYADLNTLYAAAGYPYGNGNGSTTFTMPDLRGKAPIGANPMFGSTNGALSTRILGQSYGAETTNYAPAGNISVSLTNGPISGDISISNGPMTGALDISTLTTNVSVSLGSLASNVSATNGPMTGTLDVTNNPITGAGTSAVTGANCVLVNNTEGATSVVECPPGLTVDVSDIASKLDYSVTVGLGTLASGVTVSNGAMTGSLSVTNGVPGGSIGLGSLASAVTGNKGNIASNVSVASQTFTGTPASIAIIPPSQAISYIIKT